MSAKQTILMLDDDRDFLEQGRRILDSRGYRVFCFSDGRKAWEAVEAQRPDLVITDLMMGNLDAGFTFARKIKQDPRFARTPVIIITAVGSQMGFNFAPREQKDLKAMGADAFLDKPVPPQVLIARVEELLGAARDAV